MSRSLRPAWIGSEAKHWINRRPRIIVSSLFANLMFQGTKKNLLNIMFLSIEIVFSSVLCFFADKQVFFHRWYACVCASSICCINVCSVVAVDTDNRKAILHWDLPLSEEKKHSRTHTPPGWYDEKQLGGMKLLYSRVALFSFVYSTFKDISNV